MKYPALGLSGFSAALENRTDQSPGNETYTAAQSMSAPKISATPQPLRPLRFQERTFTAPILIQFDTFNQTGFLSAFWNGKAGNSGGHHPLTLVEAGEVRRLETVEKRGNALRGLTVFNAPDQRNSTQFNISRPCRRNHPAKSQLVQVDANGGKGKVAMTLTPPLTVNPAVWKKSVVCSKRRRGKHRKVTLVKGCTEDRMKPDLMTEAVLLAMQRGGRNTRATKVATAIHTAMALLGNGHFSVRHLP